MLFRSNPGEYKEKVESVRILKKYPDDYKKWYNKCEYRKMVESGRVPRKGRICASIEELFGRLPEKCRICVSTEKW